MIIFLPGERVKPKVGSTLLELVEGIEILSVCGGLGSCGKCKVRVKKGIELLSEPSQRERAHLTPQDLRAGYRLACQAKVVKDGEIELEVPISSRREEQVLQVEGIETPVSLSPSISRYRVRLEPPTLDRVRSDHDALIEALPVEAKRISLDLLRSLPSRLREHGWEVDVVIYDDEIISVGKAERLLGFAVDLGTTKLAGYLLDLETGETLAKVSRLNPQIKYGEDVISRITHVVKDRAMASVLHAILLKAVNEMIEEAVSKAGLSHNEVFEVVAVGNTFMHHTFLNLDLSALAMSPYPPVVRAGLTYSAREFGIRAAGKVYTLPNIAGYVGADCVAAILATRICEMEGPALLMDIGTNTEIVLNDGGKLYVVSTASGPAFEGAHIKHGMRAMKGAIEGVAIDEGRNVLYRTIGNGRPIGICGSGILDALAWMVRRGIVDRSGRLKDGHVKEPEGIKAFTLVEAERTAIGEDIIITQEDIREVQKAKAAIATGIKTLLRMRGIRSDELKALFIAGAFGTYIDPSSAIEIGMLPELPLARIIQVGNAAGTGARMCLLSKEMKAKAERISREVKYVELARRPDFQKTFMESIRLAPFKV